MNLLSLVLHGLSALAVYGELVGVRLLVGCTLLALVVSVALGLLASGQIPIAATWPAWGTPALILAAVLTGQATSTGFLIAFYLLALRSRLDFVPARDYAVFLGELREVARRDA